MRRERDQAIQRATKDALRLREWREHWGLSQRALAGRAGLALSTVNELETGKRQPNFRTLRKLSDAFGVSWPALCERPGSLTAKSIDVIHALYDLSGKVEWLAPDTGEGEEAAEQVARYLAEGAPMTIATKNPMHELDFGELFDAVSLVEQFTVALVDQFTEGEIQTLRYGTDDERAALWVNRQAEILSMRPGARRLAARVSC
jgi:transcriptional regulator with XRE-family HTH domain